MKIAVWTVTRRAGENSKKIKEVIPVDIFTLKKFNVEKTIEIENFTIELEDKFLKYDAHIFVMATGIVVRKISCMLKNKDVDPAIIVIDENINFAISLVSGHLGRANELTQKISEKLKITPIITTSTDITGKIAVDTLAEKLNGQLKSLKTAKEVTSYIVDGKKVSILLPKNIIKNGSVDGLILVSNREDIKITQIYPKNIILGIGCKKGISKEIILDGINEILKISNISLKSIKHIATVDVKKDEIGLLEVTKFLNCELIVIDREKIKTVDNKFLGSDFVRKTIGVGSVSEPCALLSSNQNGEFLVQKYKKNGVTISIYEEKINEE
ncbi:MAG: cobalt-precorrin 5A hydrolase [Fusobacteriaceae bacterium]